MEIVNDLSSQRTLPADPYEKGRMFENYIIDLFNKEKFKLDKWRESRRMSNELITEEHSYPDIEMIFQGRKQYKFAVECKWRKLFYNGAINWASTDQIERYRKFKRNFPFPLFIAIGIGGHPNQPEKLFVTPFINIEMKTVVYEHELIPYNRHASRRFFYDVIQSKLF